MFLRWAWMSVFLAGCAMNGQEGPLGSSSNSDKNPEGRESAKIHTELGAGYFAQGQMAIALDEFIEATRFDPKYAMAYNGLGLVHAALKEDAKAEDNFKKALQLDPASSESHNNYGSFLCARGRYDEAIAHYQLAVKNPLYTSAASAYANAGSCSLRKQDPKGAEGFYLKALQIDPLLHQVSFQLANIYFNRGDYGQAKQVLRLPLVSRPNADMLWLAVRIERALGNKDAVSSYALELRSRFPNSEAARQLSQSLPLDATAE